MLSPRDIRNLKNSFKKKRMGGGYDTPEVDRALTDLAEKWESVQDDRRAAEARVSELEEKLKHYEKVELALQEALETARDTARRTEEAADRKARLIVEEAELRAQRIIQDAEQERYGLRQDLAALTNRQNEVSARLRGFLMSELEILAQFQGDDPVGFIKLVAPERSQEARSLDAGSDPIQLQPLDEEASGEHGSPAPEADLADATAGTAHEAVHEADPAMAEPEVAAEPEPSTADPIEVTVSESLVEPEELPMSEPTDEVHLSIDELESAEPFADSGLDAVPEEPRPSVPKSPWPDVAQPTVPPALWGKTSPVASETPEDSASADPAPEATPPSSFRSAPVPGWTSPSSGFSTDDDEAGTSPAEASGGWSLRSLVTGDGDATDDVPEESPDSIANREQIRRIMEGLD